VIPTVTRVDYVYVRNTITLQARVKTQVNLDGVERVAYNDARLTATIAGSAADISQRTTFVPNN
jgi:hypothetical protein